MNLSFDNPTWWLLAAALVPLVVHLVARTRPKERRFSSVQLLQELVRLQARRARPKDWLVLLLRTLLCACIAGAFLLPHIGGDAEGDSGRAVVIVLDNTASMGAADGQQVRMNRALEVAQAAVQSLSRADRANLLTLAGYPHFLFDRPESARPMLLRELARTQSRPAASAGVAEALAAARRQLESVAGGASGQVLLISDFQTSTMQEAVAEMADDEKLCCVNVAQTRAVENTTIDSMALTPAKPLPGQKVTLTVALQHRQGAVEREGVVPLSVTLSAGNLRLSQPCEVPCGGRSTVRFELTAPQEGGDWLLTARTEADAFPGDNTRYLVVPVAEKLDCLAIAADRAHLGFMLRALENIPFLHTLYLPSLPETAADFVVWHAPTAADVPAIRERLEAGETVLIVPDFVKDTALMPLLQAQDGDIAGELRTDGGHWKTQLNAAEDESFSIFGTEALAGWTQEGVYRRLGSDIGKVVTGARVLMSYPPDEEESLPVPALVRRAVGRGELLIWNMPVTARDSRQGFSPLYLPLLAEQLLHTRGSAAEAEPVAGLDYLQFVPPVGVSAQEVRLLNAAGDSLPIAVRNNSVRCEQVAEPGVYRWVVGERVLHTVAVNFPREESDLRFFTPEVAGELLSAQDAVQGGTLAARVPLWPWLLAAAFLFFVLELLICRPTRAAQRPSVS